MPLVRIFNTTDAMKTDVNQALPISFTAGLGSGDTGNAKVKTEGPWAGALEIPPTLTAAGTISGDGAIGTVYSFTGFTFSGASSYEYQWYVAGALVATTATYTTVSGDASKALSGRVRALGASGVAGDWVNATNTINISPADLLSTTSTTTISIRGVTYTVSANSTPGTAVPVGYDQNGNAVIVGSAYIIDSSAPPSLSGSRNINGIEKNPDTSSTKGYDSLIGDFDAAKIAAFPISLTPGDLAFHYICRAGATTSDYRKGCLSINGGNAIYCVSATPPAKQCTPLVHWATPATRPQLIVDAAAIRASLPAAVDVTGMDLPTWAEVKTKLGRFDPMFGIRPRGNTSNGYEIAMAYQTGIGVGAASGANYGQWQAEVWQGLQCGLMGNAWSNADKEEAILWTATHGFQWWDALRVKGIPLPFNNGGHFQFHQFPILCYLNWAGRSSEAATLGSKYPGSFGSAFRWTAERWLQTIVPHRLPSGMVSGRLRAINSVSADGLTIGTQFLRTDPVYDGAKINIDDTVFVRKSTGETRTLLRQSTGVDLAASAYLNVKIASAFSAPAIDLSEEFYMASPYTINHGDLYFTSEQPQQCLLSASQSYFNLQRPTLACMCLAWMGIAPTWIDDIARMAIRANGSSDPSGNDFPSYIDDYPVNVSTSMVGPRTFYSTHKNTILASYLTTPDTSGAISSLSVTAISATQLRITVTTTGTNGGLFAVASASGVAAPTAAQIKAGLDGAGNAAVARAAKNALAAGTYTFDIEGLPSASTSYRVSVCGEDWYSHQTSVLSTTTGTTTLSAGTMVEDFFAKLNVGDSDGDILFGDYSRSSGGFIGKIVQNDNAVLAPNATIKKGMEYFTSSSLQSLRKIGVNTLIAGCTTFEYRTRIKAGNQINADGGFGSVSSSRVTGVSVRRGGTDTTSIRLMLAGNLDTGAADTSVRADSQVLSLLSNIADGSIYEIAFRGGYPDKLTLQGKCWPLGGVEPAWTTSTSVILDGAGGAARALVGTSDLAITDVRVIGHGGSSPIFTWLGGRLGVDMAISAL